MKKKSTIYQMTTCAIMAAVMCILGPNSIPIGPVPISLTNLVLYFTVFLLGTKGSVMSYLIYLLLGAVGLPVFSGYEGGIGKLAGPTGGYLVGFIFIALIGGLLVDIFKANIWITGAGLIFATAVTYLFGTLWFIMQSNYTWGAAMALCVYPFIPFDLIKIVIATALGKAIRTGLKKAGMIEA